MVSTKVPAWELLNVLNEFKRLWEATEDVRDLEESNAILCPYQEFQTRYEVATAETPSTARRRALGRADAPGRDTVCKDLEEALARVRNILVGVRDTREEDVDEVDAVKWASQHNETRWPLSRARERADA